MVSKEYSSARLVSKHKGDWTYGRIEARAKLPSARGVWSAIWMLPTDLMYGGWPSSGEIDIMEHVGFLPDSIFSTVHTGRFNGMLGTQQTKGIASGTLDTEFHDYAIEWDVEKIDFLFDGKVYHTFRNRYEGSDVWPFDLDFHLILNIAVGGDWGGMKGVDASAWPQQMEVDYVRVYQE
jgi:beta-glucanase (GH16 family)